MLCRAVAAGSRVAGMRTCTEAPAAVAVGNRFLRSLCPNRKDVGASSWAGMKMCLINKQD